MYHECLQQWCHQYKWESLAVCKKSLVFELSCTQKSVYTSSCLLVSIFSLSLQLYRKFSAKSVLKLFEFNSTFKDSHMIIFCILHQAQFRVFTLTLIDSEVFTYVFMNKFFTQQHHLFLHQLTHSCRLQEFDDQVALINDIIHVIEIIMILDEHICYEHAWIDQSSDLILINLIRTSHDAMFSLNLAHFFESFSALLLVVQHFLHSFLSSFF